MSGDDLFVVIDRVLGEGARLVRLHWLAGDYAYAYAQAEGRLKLETPSGPFCVTVLDQEGVPLPGTVASGQEVPPRGWLSRYYGEKMAVPSLAVERAAPVPATFVSVLSAGVPSIRVEKGHWHAQAGSSTADFQIAEGGDVVFLEVAPASRT
jgi:asparagine synthase (glutamine-hydrolysing)